MIGTPTHRHKKRGTEYELIGFGKMQAERWHQRVGEQADTMVSQMPTVDMREVAVYRSVDDGSLWVRPREEFEDGRFEAFTSNPKAGAGEPVLLREAAELADEIWASLDEVRRETNLTDSWYSVAEIEGQRILDFARRIATPEPRWDRVRVTNEMVQRFAVELAAALDGPHPTPDAWIEYEGVARATLEAALNPGGRDGTVR